MSSNHNNGPGWGSLEDAYDGLEESTDPTIIPASAPPIAPPPGQSSNPFLDDEATDPGLAQVSSPGLPAVGYPTGAYSSPGFTPPAGVPIQPGAAPTGAYSSPGFTPPAGVALQPGMPPTGSYSSPGFTPPTGGHSAAHNAEHFSGQFSIPNGQQHQPSAPGSASHSAEHFTGQFTIPTGTFAPVAQEPEAPAEDMNSKRFSYGLWGSVIGAVIGAAIGVMNALVEGVSLSNGTTPMIIYAFLCMAVLGGCAAASPHVFENLLRNAGIID